MTLANALQLIPSFWDPEEPFPFGENDHSNHIQRLQEEFKHTLPESLLEYIRTAVPDEDVDFTNVGSTITLYGIDRLKYLQPGYNYDEKSQSPIESDWKASFFVIGDEDGDPILIDLQQPEDGILVLEHGAGSWEYGESRAATVGQFLLCSAAQHQMLMVDEDPIVDDEDGFCLHPEVAKWYFPRMKDWTGDYYTEWCSVFDNS